MIPAKAPNPRLMQVALSNVRLFEAPPASGNGPSLFAAIADVTGIPGLVLAAAERRIAMTGSFAPLRELFANPAVPKADGLRYELTVKQTQAHEGLAQRLTLTMSSGRGQVAVQLSVALRQRSAQRHNATGQSAHIVVYYSVQGPKRHHTFRQEVRIAAPRPPRFAVVNAQAA